MAEYRVRVQIWNRRFELQTVERTFKTEAKRDAWLDKQEASGALRSVLAFSEGN